MVRKNKTPHYPPPPIVPALRSDIPAMVRVWISATRPDLMLRAQEVDEEKLAVLLTTILTAYMEGGSTILKAVDWEDPEKITAIAIWVKKGYPSKGTGLGIAGDSRNRNTSLPRLCGGLSLATCVEDIRQPPISKFIGEQVQKFVDEWETGVKHIELELLMTDPAFQRRGIGTAILQWGHKLADREAVPCFLCASPFGYPLYKSLGWKDVAKPIVVDLKEFVQFAENGDMGWGIYKLYFMLRLPRTKEAIE